MDTQGSCYRDMPANLCPHPAAGAAVPRLLGGPPMTLAFVLTVGYGYDEGSIRKEAPPFTSCRSWDPGGESLCKMNATSPAPSQGHKGNLKERDMKNCICKGCRPAGSASVGGGQACVPRHHGGTRFLGLIASFEKSKASQHCSSRNEDPGKDR